MAYVDTKPFARKQGMAIALMINGAGVAAAFLMTTTMMDEEIFPPTIVSLSDAEKTPPPPKVEQKKAPVLPSILPPQTAITPPTVPILPVAPQGDVVIPTPPIIPDPQPLILLPDPLIVAASVLKEARPDPRFRDLLQPEYPESAIRREISGKVTVRVKVGKDGRVAAIELVRASDEVFAEATLRHATRKWRFIPASRDGKAEESWREMTVRFELPA